MSRGARRREKRQAAIFFLFFILSTMTGIVIARCSPFVVDYGGDLLLGILGAIGLWFGRDGMRRNKKRTERSQRIARTEDAKSVTKAEKYKYTEKKIEKEKKRKRKKGAYIFGVILSSFIIIFSIRLIFYDIINAFEYANKWDMIGSFKIIDINIYRGYRISHIEAVDAITGEQISSDCNLWASALKVGCTYKLRYLPTTHYVISVEEAVTN